MCMAVAWARNPTETKKIIPYYLCSALVYSATLFLILNIWYEIETRKMGMVRIGTTRHVQKIYKTQSELNTRICIQMNIIFRNWVLSHFFCPQLGTEKCLQIYADIEWTRTQEKTIYDINIIINNWMLFLLRCNKRVSKEENSPRKCARIK